MRPGCSTRSISETSYPDARWSGSHRRRRRQRLHRRGRDLDGQRVGCGKTTLGSIISLTADHRCTWTTAPWKLMARCRTWAATARSSGGLAADSIVSFLPQAQ